MAFAASGVRASPHLARGAFGRGSSRRWCASEQGRALVSDLPHWVFKSQLAPRAAAGLRGAGEAARGSPHPPPPPPQVPPPAPELSGVGAQAPWGPAMGGDAGRSGFILSGSFGSSCSQQSCRMTFSIYHSRAGTTPPLLPGRALRLPSRPRARALHRFASAAAADGCK